MFPIRDDNPSQTVPVVTRTIIAINVAVFLYEISLGSDLRWFFDGWGLVPNRLVSALLGVLPLPGPIATVFTSMFMHGGWLHLLGNLWYLWIFGDNVEDVLGHAGFLAFYLACGAAATLLHYFVDPVAQVPTVGASGAIAAVLGAYLVAFPRARVFTLLPIFPFFQVVPLPAFFLLGLWFVFQFVLGLGALGASGGGGIAFWAHIGGFAFGLLAMRALLATRRSRAREV